MSPFSKPIDPIVTLGVGAFIVLTLLVALGMYLSRPDRSIPPYTIGSQEGTVVAVHLPHWTSDSKIESLIHRFGKVGGATHAFASMKIQPTTPTDPKGSYQRMTVYIFTDSTWTEPEVLHRFLVGQREIQKDKKFRQAFKASIRGGFQIDQIGERGWMGHGTGEPSPSKGNDMRWLFIKTFGKHLPQPFPHDRASFEKNGSGDPGI